MTQYFCCPICGEIQKALVTDIKRVILGCPACCTKSEIFILDKDVE